MGISKTDERLEIFDYSESVFYDEIILVVKKGREFDFNSFEDLEGLVIGVCRGCSYGPDYEEASAYFTKVEDDNSNQRLRKLLMDRIDAAIISPGELGLNMIIKNDPYLYREQFSIIEKPLALDPNYLAFNKSMHMVNFLERFNKVIEEGNASGVFQNIISRIEAECCE